MSETEKIEVLLIEDNYDDAELLREMLVEAGETRFRITHVDRLADGIRRLKSGAFDIVLLDLSLPDSDGLKTFSRIQEAAPFTPVVVLTGLADEKVGVSAVQGGAQDYLVKGTADETHIARSMRFAIERAKNVVTTQSPKQASLQRDHTMVFEGLPKFLAGYSVVRTLGEGSVGIVFLAEKPNPDGDPKRYALKILRPGGGPEGLLDELSRRFLYEAEIIASFQHRNIVRIVEYGNVRDTGVPYIVMEFIDGMSMGDFIGAKNGLTYEGKLRLIRQVAEALATIHRRRVFHRDIKPDNIIVTRDLVAKLTDFGIARRPESDLTGPVEVMGTPAYMAPESFASTLTDHRADIFSLGTLSYELLVGKRPFAGETIPQLAEMIRSGCPEAPTKVVPEFPPALQYVLSRMLKKRPEWRYQSATELIADIDAFLDGRLPGHDGLSDKVHRFFFRDWA